MTAFLGALINSNMKAYLYLDIRDLFRDTIYEILPKPVSFFILPIVKLIEKFTFCSSSKINLVSVGFNSYVKKILRNNSEIQITNFSNGIDDQFLKKSFKVKKKFNSTIKTILFAGNIGEGQGLHKIIPEVAMQLKDCIRFKVIGDGGAFLKLKNKIKSLNIGNVDLIKPMSRNELCDFYLKADILFVHLNNNEAFKKVIPSKLYEYASIGKPILAGLEGVSYKFVKKEIDGTELFKPCDVKSFISAYNKLIKKGRFYNRLTFKKKYSRKHIMKKMIDDLLVDIKV